ncbi:hypothetical protein BGZ50_006234 [Haplosporangium sp. Z 11]|nr:hypothetical protein BGZ50_006234 [Haplosporangium sp. Z 11]
MASTPVLNGALNKEQLHNINNNNINSNGAGPTKGLRFQQDVDAIVPASDHDDDSTEEDEAYNSYIHEQEQQRQQHHLQKQSLGLTAQHSTQYDSADEAEMDEGEDGNYTSYRQQEQQQAHHHQHQQLQQIQQQYQLQQQQHLHAYKSQAMNIQQLLLQDHSQDHDMNGTDSHEEEEYYQQNPQHNPHRQHMDVDMIHQQIRQNGLQAEEDDDFDDDFDDDMDEDEGHEDEEMMDEDDDEDTETMSLTEDDIDFNLVYAFHTFVATQEGQASVVRNDSLMLLEDTNVYWWLVRVLKTGVIGYIPAENIETPFERLARLNTYRNVALSAPSSEWGTFDEHIQPLDPHILEQRALNRKSVIFTAQNEFLEASETEWTDEEYEEGDWYEDGEEYDEEEGEEGVQEDEDVESDEQLLELDVPDDDSDDLASGEGSSLSTNGHTETTQDIATSVIQSGEEKMSNQKKPDGVVVGSKMDMDRKQGPVKVDEVNENDREVQATNRHRKPLLDEDDLFSNAEPRLISLTPSIARDDSLSNRGQGSQGKARNMRQSEDMTSQQHQSVQQQQQQQTQANSATKSSANASSGHQSQSVDSEDEERERMKKKMAERKEAKLNALLGNKNVAPVIRKSKEEYEQGLPPEAVVIKKPGKFKSLFGVGKSSKDKERKEKERLEKERLKNLAKSSSSGSSSVSSSISTNIFRTRSNSNGSVGSAGAGSSSSTVLSANSGVDKGDAPQQDIMTLRVYPGNVDFGASMYKTVVVTPTTMASEVAHQAVVKFRLAPDGTASTGDFYLTVKGVDGDETVLQATDKPMAIYQSLTAHLTTPLPPNHRLSISSVSSMMSVNSNGSYNSNNNHPSSTASSPSHPTLRRTSPGKTDPQKRSIRFLLNKKIRRASSISMASLPSTPTTPTAPQEDFFWVKVVCQAQDLPQSMILLDGMGTAMEKSDPRTHNQTVATKVEHWIPMHATSNAGDVIFRTLEKVAIRSGVVNGVPEHILAAKRASSPNGLVIEYQLGIKLNGSTSKKYKQGEEVPLPPQIPLSKCFEEHQLVPIRRSPKADVASMPTNPEYVFFLRKATKSLQAEMRFVQEQLVQQSQRQPPVKKAPSPLQVVPPRAADTESVSSAQPSPTTSVSNSSSPALQNRALNTGHPVAVSAGTSNNINRLVIGNGAGSPPIRIPRRTDSVIMSPTSPIIRTNSFDNSSGRPSPTLSSHSMMGTQQIHASQLSRTPTPDRHSYHHQQQQQQNQQQQNQQQQHARARSPSVSQGSPTPVARPLQAPSPAPSNLSSHADPQEGSRSSTPERPTRFERPERQRATSPSLTHGPSPLSMSAVMMQNGTSSPTLLRMGSLHTAQDGSSTSSLSGRLNMKKNTLQGVDIVLNKGFVRSSRCANPSNPSQSKYQYSFVPLEGDEEIDITELIEDVLGGDSDDEDEENQQQRFSDSVRDLESMSRRERAAAAVARASRAVAAGKERRKAGMTSRSVSNSPLGRRSPLADRDRLEYLGASARGAETLQKLERVLTGDQSSATARSGSAPDDMDTISKSLANRNLPSPISLSSSSPSTTPTFNRRTSDSEVHVASVASVASAGAGPAKDSAGQNIATAPSSPSSPSMSGYTRPILLSSIASVSNQKGTNSNPSSPSSLTSPHQRPMDMRPFSPLPRPLQAPSPASQPHQLSIQTGISSVSSSKAGPSSASVAENNSNIPGLYRSGSLDGTNSRSRSVSASVAELSKLGTSGKNGAHGASASEPSGTTLDPWLLSSDYNTGMQDLLTLVRGGRSSSVSTSAPSSMRGGLTFGKDGRIVQQPSSSTRQRQLSLQHQSSPPQSLSSLYNSHVYNSHNHKDTQAHDRHLDGLTASTRASVGATTNDPHHQHLMNNNINTIDEDAKEDDEDNMDEDELAGFGQRKWTRTDRRLRDVQDECHPDVFDCWKEVDSDLDKVERELDALLATVKSMTF